MAKISFNITIKNWAKHNSNKKKNHRYFFLENRFFQDDKISQLSAIETRLYLYLLTVASDLNQDSYILHTNLIPSYFRLRTNSIQDSLIKFESLQLVKYEKNASNTIENKTNLDKIIKILIITTLINAGIFLYSCTTNPHPLTFKNQVEVRNATELGMEQLFLEDHEKACFYFEQASEKNLELFFSVMGNSVDYCF